MMTRATSAIGARLAASSLAAWVLFGCAPYTAFQGIKGSGTDANAHWLSQFGDTALKIVVLSVGSGQCVFVRCPNGNGIVNDCGSVAQSPDTELGIHTASSLLSGISGEKYLVLSHGHADHINLVPFVVDQIAIDQFFYGGETSDYTDTSFVDWLKEALDADPPRIPAGQVPTRDEPGHPNQLLPCGTNPNDGAYVLASNAAWGKNDQSIVMSYRMGKFVAITMGDAEAGTETDMMTHYRNDRAFLRATLLIAAHHGSDNRANTRAWAQVDRPMSIVYSAGNKFGHPRCTSVANYKEQNSFVTAALHKMTCWISSRRDSPEDTSLAEYNTYDNDTAVVVETDGSNWSILTCAHDTITDQNCVLSYRGKLQ